MKQKLKRIAEIMKSWSLKQKIAVGGATAAAVAGIIGGVVYIQLASQPEEDATEAVVEEEEETVTVEAKTYASVGMSYDSLEKDITLYFLDENGEKIVGEEFSAKIVSTEDAANLAEYVTAVTEAKANRLALLNGEDDAETDDATEETDDASEETDDATEETEEELVATLSEEDLVKYVELQQAEQEAMEAYATALDDCAGVVLTDEDMDGMVAQSDMESGDFVALFVPRDGYEATSYAMDTTIKDEIVYEVVDVSNKKVAYSAADDSQAETHETVVEATPTDTVAYVESSKTVIPAEYATSTDVTSMTASTGTDTTIGELTIASGGTLYSGVSTANSITLTGGGATIASLISDDTAVATVTANGDDSYTITAAGGVKKTTTVSLSGTYTASDNTTTSFQITETVIGTSTLLTTSSGDSLYVKNGNDYSEATIADYLAGSTLYIMTSEEITIYYGWQTIDGNRYYYDINGNKVTGIQTIGGATYTFGNDGVLLTAGTGIDVSKWQGSIDWTQVATVASFAIIRAGYRGSSGGIAEDPYAVANVRGANNAGVKVGMYFYSMALTEAQAVEEASLAVSIAQKAGTVSLPIYIDIESSTQLSLTTEQRDAIVNAFCSTVQSAGYRAGVYANYNWLTKYLTPSSYSGNISIWIARYNTTTGYSGRYDIWQYTSSGSVPGISGNVDMNISYF